MTSLRVTTLTLVISALFGAGPAFADGWPTSVAGNWSVIGNQAQGEMGITQYPGLAGSACKPIRGTIYGGDAIEGFYCPRSGRIAFQRYIGNTTTPRQYWSGNLSQVVNGQPMRIGGNFSVFDHNDTQGTSGGSLGEYNFTATR
jgi:hypothetical protein